MARKSKGIYRKYDMGVLKRAVAIVQSGGLSVRQAASQFGIPKSTISDRLTGKITIDAQPGRPPAVPLEIEKKIVEKVTNAASCGLGITRKQLLLRTGRLCSKTGIKTPFKDGIPGKSYFAGLKARHPEITIRKPEKLGTSRARMLNPTVVDKYMTDLGTIVDKLNLRNKPMSIWNMDETGKQFEHNPVRVIARKGVKNLPGRTSNQRTNTTILACVNAGGQVMLPMLIVKGKTRKSLYGWNTAVAPTGTIWSYQEKAWMTDEIGAQWFEHVFIKHCGESRPQLLLLDSHSSHETLDLLEMAERNDIHILALPPHTTHHLQPLDKSVFGPFSSAYNKHCTEFLSASPANTINKWTFTDIFSKAWSDSLTESNIKSGFRACGIYPLNKHAVSTEGLLPSSVYDKPQATATCSRASESEHAEHELAEHDPFIAQPITVEEHIETINETSTLEDEILSGAARVLVPICTPNDPNEYVDLRPATGMEVTELFPELDSYIHVPQYNWNADIDAIFGVKENEEKSKSSTPSTKRSLTSHRLLTSADVIKEKRIKLEEKQKRENAKEERRRQAETRKALKVLKSI